LNNLLSGPQGLKGLQEILPWVIFLISFLLGSIPFGLIVARIFHVTDLTAKGSGNIGASNVSRVVGFWPAGFITFVLDVSKGMLSIGLAMPLGCRFIARIMGSPEVDNLELSYMAVWAAGFFAVLGHCYSPWLHFRGGKGVATGLGVAIVLSPISATIGMFGFAIMFFHKRIASLSSIAGLVLTAVVYLVIHPVGVHLWVGAALLFLILVRHEANIDALLENREKPLPMQ
jgi:glycerol-3-phosphate acyltransferase PlsY